MEEDNWKSNKRVDDGIGEVENTSNGDATIALKVGHIEHNPYMKEIDILKTIGEVCWC